LNMRAWRMASVDYLEQMRRPLKYSKLDDYHILKAAVYKLHKVAEPPELNGEKFAKAHGQDNLPQDKIDPEEIQSALDYRSTPEPYFPAGETFDQQVQSLLQANQDLLTADDGVRRALVHLLGRQVIRLPEGIPGSGLLLGLDFLSSALFQLHYLGIASRTPVRWLHLLQQRTSPEDTSSTRWHPRTLRMDGAANSEYEWLLGRVRRRLRILVYAPIRILTESYNTRPGLIRVYYSDIMKTLDVPRAQARQIYDYVQLTLTERFIPSLQMMGIQYRCTISPHRKARRPIGTLCEHMSLGKSSESPYGGLSIFLEPYGVDGPMPEDEFTITADTEIVSFRMDLFDHTAKDGEQIGVWEYDLDETPLPKRGMTWVLKRSPSHRRARTMTKSERMLLSILWVHRGSPEQRIQLLRLMDFPERGLREAAKSLKTKNAYAVAYYPSPEYCGIPQGIMIASRATTRKDREELQEWLVSSFPFVRHLSGEEGQLTIARVREGGGQIAAAAAKGVSRTLASMGIENTTAVCDVQRTFYATALGRLYSDVEGGWRDPWT
jgi:hypothetical protein